MRRKLWIAQPCLAICLAATTPALLPQDEPPGMPARNTPRVEGQFWFWNGHHMAMMDLHARLGRFGRPGFGNLVYTDEGPDGARRNYNAGIDLVVIDGPKAMVSGRIMGTNVPEWEGLGVQVWLEDSGRPSGRDDEVSAMFFTWPDTAPYTFCPMATAVINGNIAITP